CAREGGHNLYFYVLDSW
nr:immunoglobulin heavy chain junction region [Macaca mulatta]MOV89045.1 immunoglobulin heavy chain junction region [Macaca mulatta]